MTVRLESAPPVVTAHLAGEIDHHEARHIREQVDLAVERIKARELRLDFSGVTFMDSAGVGLLMGRFKLMQSLGGRLVVTNVPTRLERMMKLAGLDRLPIWEVQPDKGEVTDETRQ